MIIYCKKTVHKYIHSIDHYHFIKKYHSLELFFYLQLVNYLEKMAGLTNTDKALTFSYLMYLNDLRGSGKLSEDSAEGLEGLYCTMYIHAVMHMCELFITS